MAAAFAGTPIDDAFFAAASSNAIDITAPEVVEITTDIKRGVVWVNVNGVCVLRCCRIRDLTLGNTPMYRNREYDKPRDEMQQFGTPGEEH